MSLLLKYPEALGNRCSQFESHPLLSCFLPIYHGVDIKQTTKEFKAHVHTHRIVIIVIIVVVTMLTLYYSIMSHATLFIVFLSHIHVNTK